MSTTSPLKAAVDRVADDIGFSGAVRVDIAGDVTLEVAYGFADRRHEISNSVDTQFAIASGGKGFTALVVVSLIADGTLDLATPARSVLGADLPLIDDGVTVEHLLAHRSGIGDYIDEDLDGDINDYASKAPVHELVAIEQFVAVLDGYPMQFAPGERFKYCNAGFVVLGLIAERASGVPYRDLVQQRVCEPAGMVDTAFLRSDSLPGRAALGYVTMDGAVRTNVFHLPVAGSPDGGVYSTLADITSFWAALFAGRIVAPKWVDEMVRPRSDSEYESGSLRYGLGFWLRPGNVVMFEGFDAGVSFRSVHDPSSRLTHTVMSNTSDGAWPMTRKLAEELKLS